MQDHQKLPPLVLEFFAKNPILLDPIRNHEDALTTRGANAYRDRHQMKYLYEILYLSEKDLNDTVGYGPESLKALKAFLALRMIEIGAFHEYQYDIRQLGISDIKAQVREYKEAHPASIHPHWVAAAFASVPGAASVTPEMAKAMARDPSVRQAVEAAIRANANSMANQRK